MPPRPPRAARGAAAGAGSEVERGGREGMALLQVEATKRPARAGARILQEARAVMAQGRATFSKRINANEGRDAPPP
jgi:hypothetical protein